MNVKSGPRRNRFHFTKTGYKIYVVDRSSLKS
jgi:hypothetical protein